MTYKHIKFQDSETMRSLVKVAYDKGLLKEESGIDKIVKKASKNPALDLSASENVQESLLKLCAGLRAKGFAAYASKIEDKIAQIKVAEVHMYNVHDETGEELLEFAHPEGSPEVAPAENDEGTVEDLIEIHNKVKEVAEKSASVSKMSKAEVIKAVKVALGFNDVDYPTFVSTFVPMVKGWIVDPIYKKAPWYEAPLKNGKKASDYFTFMHWRGLNQLEEKLTGWAQEWQGNPGKREFIIGRTADYVHLVFEFLSAVNDTIDMPGTPFTVKFAREAMANLRPFAGKFEELFAKFHGNQDAANYHGRSIPADYLGRQAANTNAALDGLLKKIDVRIMDDPDVNANPQIKGWFENEKKFINDRKAQFLQIVREAAEYQQKGAAANRPDAGLITIEVLRELVKKVNPKLLGDQDLKFGSLDEFMGSLAAYARGIQNDCVAALKAALPEGAPKNQLLSYMS